MNETNPFGGKITNPLGTGGAFEGSYGDVGSAGGGLVGLISNLLKFGTIAAGVFALFNIIIAGFMYISAGENPETTAQAWQKIYMSLIGLAVIAGAFTVAAILSYILFGDATVILNPTIYGPGGDN